MPRHALRPLALVAVILIAAPAWLSFARPVRGHVSDAATGQPLAGVLITIGAQQALTDGEGRFQVAGVRGLPPVRASTPGYRPVNSALARARLIGAAPQISLSLRPVELRGTVVDAETQAPLAGATVRAGENEAQTDSQGHYSIKRVVAGARITAHAPYYAPGDPVVFAGQPSEDFVLTLLPVTVEVRNLYSDEPLAGATVTAAGETAQSDARGRVTFARLQPGTQIIGALPEFDRATVKASPGDTVKLGLRPNTLRGTVRNQEGQPLASALVLLRAADEAPRPVYTNAAGEYEIKDVPLEASLRVRKAGYALEERPLGRETGLDFALEPFVAKGIYIPFGLLMPSMAERLQENLDLVERTEMNAVVIDIKGDRAWLAFKPRYPLAQEIDASYDGISDLRETLAECQRRNIYTIARMVVFKDNVLAKARPQWAVLRGDGSLWIDNEGLAWADPFRQEVWDYNLAIAVEAVEMGFDEIQLDYIRFPSDGDIYDTHYLHEDNKETRTKAIADFLAYMRAGLDKTGAFFSIDVFGLTTSVDSDSDLGIGQRLVNMAPHVDYVSPMVYPSTYIPGNLALRDPQRRPYEVVNLSILDAQKKTSTLIRPWLQHYSLWGVQFGTHEFRLQKQAAIDAAAHGWLFWNAGSVYDPLVFDP